jgi:hypothetical protein
MALPHLSKSDTRVLRANSAEFTTPNGFIDGYNRMDDTHA